MVTATAHQPLLDIVKLLTQYRIGCIVIVDDNDNVRGIISEHDLIRAIGEAGAKALSKPVSNFMTTAVVAARRSASPSFYPPLEGSARPNQARRLIPINVCFWHGADLPAVCSHVGF